MDLLLDEGPGRIVGRRPERAGGYVRHTITAALLNGFTKISAGQQAYHIDITPEYCRCESRSGPVGYRSPVPRASAVSINVASNVG